MKILIGVVKKHVFLHVKYFMKIFFKYFIEPRHIVLTLRENKAGHQQKLVLMDLINK